MRDGDLKYEHQEEALRRSRLAGRERPAGGDATGAGTLEERIVHVPPRAGVAGRPGGPSKVRSYD
jgi:hypothetical protein